MLGGLEKRPFAASAKFVTAEPHDGASIADTGNIAPHNQFERTSVLQQEGPRNVSFHISACGRGGIRQKQNSAPAQLGGDPAANAKRAFFSGVVETEMQLDVIAPVDSPISVDYLDRHSSSILYNRPISTICTVHGVLAKIFKKYYWISRNAALVYDWPTMANAETRQRDAERAKRRPVADLQTDLRRQQTAVKTLQRMDLAPQMCGSST
jgi:hypothetical protein